FMADGTFMDKPLDVSAMSLERVVACKTNASRNLLGTHFAHFIQLLYLRRTEEDSQESPKIKIELLWREGMKQKLLKELDTLDLSIAKLEARRVDVINMLHTL